MLPRVAAENDSLQKLNKPELARSFTINSVRNLIQRALSTDIILHLDARSVMKFL